MYSALTYDVTKILSHTCVRQENSYIILHWHQRFLCDKNVLLSTHNYVGYYVGYYILSHNNPCFPCNIAITNFLVSNTCKIRFHDVIDRTIPMFIS